jgi:hypothetical protein
VVAVAGPHPLSARQRFRFAEDDATIRTADGRCLSVVGGAAAAAVAGGAPVVAAPCKEEAEGTAAAQRWVFADGTGTLGRLVLQANPSICLLTLPSPNGVSYPYPPTPSGLGLDPPDRRKNDTVWAGPCEAEPRCPTGKSAFVERSCLSARPPQHWLLLGDSLLPTSGRYDSYEYFNPPTAPYGLDSWSDDHELCLSLALDGDLQVWGGPLSGDRVAWSSSTAGALRPTSARPGAPSRWRRGGTTPAATRGGMRRSPSRAGAA